MNTFALPNIPWTAKADIMNDFSCFENFLNDFTFLTQEDCDLFEPYLKLKHFQAKEHLVVEGKVCKELGFVNNGSFRTYYLADGKEINTHFTFENQFVVDYDSFLQQTPSHYYIQALEDAEVITFHLEALQNAYQKSKNWEKFGRLMAEESYMLTIKRVESFMFLDGEQRYLQLMEKEPQILERIPLYHIASYLGLERESLSRLRKKIAGK